MQQIPVMVFCSELKVARQLQLFRGLFPVLPPNLKGANVEDSAWPLPLDWVGGSIRVVGWREGGMGRVWGVD